MSKNKAKKIFSILTLRIPKMSILNDSDILKVTIRFLYALKIITFPFRIVFCLENKFVTCFVYLLILLCFTQLYFVGGLLDNKI